MPLRSGLGRFSRRLRQFQHDARELPVRRHGGAGMDRRPPLPVGIVPAGAFNDGLQRRRVPQTDKQVDHHVGAASGDQEEAVGVAPGAGEAGVLFKMVVDATDHLASLAVELAHFGGDERRLGKLAGRRDARLDRGAVADREPRRPADGGVDDLAGGGGVDDANERLVVLHHGDERRVHRDAADEALRAVDGVEDPAVGGRAGLLAEFLAQDGVVGEAG